MGHLQFVVALAILVFSSQLFAISIKAPNKTERHNMDQIIDQLQPDELHPLFEDIHDLKGFDQYEETPVLRQQDIIINDERFQEGFQLLVAMDEVRDGDLVINDTGHAIPTLYQLLQGNFNVHFALHFPEKYQGLDLRILPQAQTYGEEIHLLKSRFNQNRPTVFYLGLDAHRSDVLGYHLEKQDRQITSDQLPSADQLKAAGVKRIVYLVEAFPYFKKFDPHGFAQFGERDLLDYLDNTAKAHGIEVSSQGIDCRSRKDLNGFLPYGRYLKGCAVEQIQTIIEASIQDQGESHAWNSAQQ